MRTMTRTMPLLLAAVVAGCATPPPAPDATLARPGVGTAVGGVAGAAIGRALAGNHNNTAAILAGVALGGLAGNMFLDRPSEIRSGQEREIERDRETARRLDYERQAELQREDTRRQIEEQRLFERWKAERSGAQPMPAADTLSGQRLLTALGYYRGPLDGRMGAQTRSAVMQFEDDQGLPRTGVLTPSLVSRMRAML